MGVMKHGFGIDVGGGKKECDKNYTDIQIDYRVKPYLKEIYHKLSLPFNFISAKEAAAKHGRKLRGVRKVKDLIGKVDKRAVRRFYRKLKKRKISINFNNMSERRLK